MKIKKVIIIIISIFLMCIPTKAFAWLQYDTYNACNKVNICISLLLILVAIIICIAYISISISYIRHSKKEKSQKVKDLLKWLVITIIQISVLIFGALGVGKIGMEWYWYPSGERFQFNEIDGYISNSIRIIAFISIIAYIVTAIIYFFKSKKENDKKLINLVKWQIITIALVFALLLLATNW